MADDTIGTMTSGETRKPMPCSSSQATTPDAASNPKALPPLNDTAKSWSTRRAGWSRSVSRVPGEPPRTSTPPTAPLRHITTVQPVALARSV